MEHRRYWTEEEVKKLVELYPTSKSDEIAEALHRTLKSVLRKAHNLGLKKDSGFFVATGILGKRNRRDLWTKEEVETLKREYRSAKCLADLQKFFKNRSIQAIKSKGYKLGLKLESSECLPHRNGLLGEQKAEDIFSKIGWKILSRAKGSVAYDFIVERNGESMAINVKYGKQIVILTKNLERLLKYPSPAFFVVTDKEAFLLPVIPLEKSFNLSASLI